MTIAPLPDEPIVEMLAFSPLLAMKVSVRRTFPLAIISTEPPGPEAFSALIDVSVTFVASSRSGPKLEMSSLSDPKVLPAPVKVRSPSAISVPPTIAMPSFCMPEPLLVPSRVVLPPECTIAEGSTRMP